MNLHSVPYPLRKICCTFHKHETFFCTGDDFDVYPNDSINITYELWFDVDKYFGTHTHETSSWINFYTFFHKDGRITAVYEIDCDDHTESFDWELTAEEEFFFRNMMNRYCNKLYGCSVPALWSERETA